MDIGEHPAGNRGRILIFTNADEVKMYKNGVFIRSYTHKDSPYKHIPNPPIEVVDFIGDAVERGEHFTPLQARFVKDMLNHNARFGADHMPPAMLMKAAFLMARYGMTFEQAYQLNGKYIGDWGDAAIEYRFDAIRDGVVVKSVRKSPVKARVLRADPYTTRLREGETYDATLVRIAMTDQNDNVLPFYNGALRIRAEGPIALIGAEHNMLRGGLGGVIVRTTGGRGEAKLTIEAEGAAPVTVTFTVE
jgi:beta-galactosidase